MSDGDRPSVSPDEVRQMAALARLELTDDEAARLAVELAGILDHVEALDPAPAMAHRAPPIDPAGPGALPTPLRPDEPDREAMERDPEAFAPEFREGFFLAPRLASHRGDAAPDPASDAPGPESA